MTVYSKVRFVRFRSQSLFLNGLCIYLSARLLPSNIDRLAPFDAPLLGLLSLSRYSTEASRLSQVAGYAMCRSIDVVSRRRADK